MKKSIRKILRQTNKHIRYTGSKNMETELTLHFCGCLRNSGIDIKSSTALTKLYERQIARAQKLIAHFHEDLQYDYRKRIGDLLL